MSTKRLKVPADTAAAGTVQGTAIKAKKKNYKQESKLKLLQPKSKNVWHSRHSRNLP